VARNEWIAAVNQQTAESLWHQRETTDEWRAWPTADRFAMYCYFFTGTDDEAINVAHAAWLYHRREPIAANTTGRSVSWKNSMRCRKVQCPMQSLPAKARSLPARAFWLGENARKVPPNNPFMSDDRIANSVAQSHVYVRQYLDSFRWGSEITVPKAASDVSGSQGAFFNARVLHCRRVGVRRGAETGRIAGGDTSASSLLRTGQKSRLLCIALALLIGGDEHSQVNAMAPLAFDLQCDQQLPRHTDAGYPCKRSTPNPSQAGWPPVAVEKTQVTVLLGRILSQCIHVEMDSRSEF
jgi:hypothetical protein